jgi:hypothetical protein
MNDGMRKAKRMMGKGQLKALWIVAALCVALTATAQGVNGGQQTAPDSACVLQKDIYQCDWLAFRHTFDVAKTVSVQAEPQDEHSDRELRRLARQLGKDVVPSREQPADLTLLLVPLNKDGIYIGPGEENLGTLRIYTGRTTGNPGTLVWAETYRGTKDIPWPSVEFYLIHQFEARLRS